MFISCKLTIINQKTSKSAELKILNGTKLSKKHNKCMHNLNSCYTCQIFSVKCVRFFISTESEFPKIYQRLEKIA